MNNKKYAILILVSFLSFFSLNSVFATNPSQDTWEEVDATINVVSEKVDKFSEDGTILGSLLNSEKKRLEDVTESDGKVIKFFLVKYKAPVKSKDNEKAVETIIEQSGLYRTLNPKIQTMVEKSKTGAKVRIRYSMQDPVLIELLINKEPIGFPTLITKTIDDKWKEDKSK
jgi:hypothetical protein